MSAAPATPATPAAVTTLTTLGFPTRVTRRALCVWSAAGLATLTLTDLAGACTTTDSALDVTLAELTDHTEAYQGRRVRVTGTVRRFLEGTPDEHFVLEDAQHNRVQLRGPAPATLIPLVGQRVQVEGRFTFGEGVGRIIQVEQLAPVVTPGA